MGSAALYEAFFYMILIALKEMEKHLKEENNSAWISF